MSETAVVALVSIIATVLVALSGHTKDYLVRKQDIAAKEREREQDVKEWQRRTLFTNRSESLCEAYSWIMKLNRAWNRQLDSQDVAALALEARSWYDAHVYYLHDDFPRNSDFVGACNASDVSGFGDNMNGYLRYLSRRAQWLGFDRMEQTS